MSENEKETSQGTGEETVEPAAEQVAAPAAEQSTEAAVEPEQEAPEPQAEKKPKKAKATAGEKAAPAQAEEEKEPPVSEKQAPAKVEKAKKSKAVNEIIATIKSMTVLELSELVKALEAEFGVSAAAPVVATAAGPTEAAAPAEEKTEFKVLLKEIGANKISVIKAVRELTTLGLKESKDLVESAPATVKEGVTKEEAATMEEKLKAAGATVEVT